MDTCNRVKTRVALRRNSGLGLFEPFRRLFLIGFSWNGLLWKKLGEKLVLRFN